MNPLRIRATNYRTFEHLDLDLPVGCVAVTGQVVGSGATDSNGAGKSTLVNAIDVALFGPSSRSFRPALTRGAAGTELMVELTFDHAGELYRVRRSFSARGAGKTTVDLERRAREALPFNGTGADCVPRWEPLTLGSAKETQALLESLLGFSRPTFRASSFLVQRDSSAFTLADPAVRKRILADALGLDRWESLRAAVRRDLRAAEQEAQRIDGRLEGVTAETLRADRDRLLTAVSQLDVAAAEAELALESAESQLAAAAQTWQAEQTLLVERSAAIATRDAAASAYSAHARLQEDALQAASTAADIKHDLDQLPVYDLAALEQQERENALLVQAHRDLVRDREEQIRLRELRETEKKAVGAQAVAATRKAGELDEKIEQLESGELGTCPTCEQQLGADARQATIGSLRAHAQQAIDEARALFERAEAIVLPDVPAEPEPLDLADVAGMLRQAREAELTRARHLERLRGLSDTIQAAADPAYLAELERLMTAWEAAAEALEQIPPGGDIMTLRNAAVRARAIVEIARAQAGTAQREKAVAEERLAQHTARAEQLERDLAARDRLTGEIDLLAILDRAYSPDGIPALILENAAIPQLEAEASRLLQLLGGPVSRVELRTDRAKQDGGIRDDVLDIVCVTDTGDCVYDDLSGGEGFRVDIALRLALAQLLATRRGAEVKLLVIDEPDGLDASGKQALIEILRNLETRGGLERIFLISHDSDLRDSFDQVIEVVKDQDGRSRIVGVEELAVAA